MTSINPTRAYVYQPFGSITHPEHERLGILWGVSGPPEIPTIRGLTKVDAQTLCDFFNAFLDATGT